jgi:DUF2892 family protein
MRFARWMASSRGRWPRVIVGLLLIAFGIYLQSPWGILISIIGVVPLGSGIDNFCLLGPAFGGGVDGRRLVKKT